MTTNKTEDEKTSKQRWEEILGHMLEIEEAKEVLESYATKRVIEELKKLESLPNVYPEKIEGQYTHVEAIYKSAVTNQIAQLEQELQEEE